MSSRGNSMSSYFSRFAPDLVCSGSGPTRGHAPSGEGAPAASLPSQRSMESLPQAGASDSQSGGGSQNQSRFDAILNGNRLTELKRGMDTTVSSVEALTVTLKLAVDHIYALENKVENILTEVKRLRGNTSYHEEQEEEQDVEQVDEDVEEVQSQDVQEYLVKKCRTK